MNNITNHEITPKVYTKNKTLKQTWSLNQAKQNDLKKRHLIYAVTSQVKRKMLMQWTKSTAEREAVRAWQAWINMQ